MSRKHRLTLDAEAIRQFIAECPTPPTRREIARAFGVKREEMVELDRILLTLSHKKPRGRSKLPGHEHRGSTLPEVCAVEIVGIDDEGQAVARPLPWEDTRREPPHILLAESDRGAPAIGERALVKLTKSGPRSYRASLIRTLPDHALSERVLGILVASKEGMMLEPVNRKDRQSYKLTRDAKTDAIAGELVLAELVQAERKTYGAKPVKVIERLGNLDSPRAASMIAIHRHEIPTSFDPASILQAESAPAPAMEAGREDLRDYELVTIDGEDARDFDDAVWAEPDTTSANPGGWHLLVAIADVAHYVRIDDALDKDAFLRGNSVYFPDRVVPMLPEALSNGLCSLKPEEERFCMAVHLWITAQGEIKRYKFVRGLMRSRARLTYEQVQAMHENTEPQPLGERIAALYGAYESLKKDRAERGTMELELPEFKVMLGADGKVASVGKRERLDSHRLIEECMIAANVAAAQALGKARMPAIYRVHESPDAGKLLDLSQFLKSLGYHLSASQAPKAAHFNKILLKAKGTPEAAMINTIILRSQMQAYYSPQNRGHFGLALEEYCHFTSPIRRYSDLAVHRGLIALLDKDASDGMTPAHAAKLTHISEHISVTERRAMMAEREAVDRYIVAFMADRVGAVFRGAVSSVNSFGVFVVLSDTGASGFIPLAFLGGDFYHYSKPHNSLVGRRTGQRIQIGQTVEVELAEANTITGSLQFRLVSLQNKDISRRPAPKGKKGEYRKIGSKKEKRTPRKRR